MKRLLLSLLAVLVFPFEGFGAGYRIKENMMTDEKIIAFLLVSENKVSNTIGNKESAGLAVVCTNGEPSVRFVTPTYNGNSEKVGTRWNAEKASYSYWERASNGTGFFHKRSKEFINETRKRNFLTLAWYPYQSSEEAVKFDLNSQNWKADIEQSIKDGCEI